MQMKMSQFTLIEIEWLSERPSIEERRLRIPPQAENCHSHPCNGYIYISVNEELAIRVADG